MLAVCPFESFQPMIRRPHNNGWLLIPQIEHARLAFDLARHWGNHNVRGLPLPHILLPTIEHHDDGWAEWEQAPEVDPESGLPRDFMEMPAEQSTRIWTDSVEACARHYPLAGIWVSRHFCYLAEHMANSDSRSEPEKQRARDFLAQQEELQREWLRQLGEQNCMEEFSTHLDWGLRLLQAFDRFSLWLCCKERRDAFEIEFPGFGELQLTPLEGRRVALKPHPFKDTEFAVSASGRYLSRQTFSSSRELHAELTDAGFETLLWTFLEQTDD